MTDWRVETDDPEHGLIVTDGFGTIASVGPCGTPDAEDVRNAHLLAAAPKMREAYGRLHDMLSDMIEGGRLTEADIPDDYAALVHQLTGPCLAAMVKAEGRA